MSEPRLLVTGPFDDRVLTDLQCCGFQITRRGANMCEDELKEAVPGIDGYLMGGNEIITADVLDNANRLKAIVFMGEQPETFLGQGVKDILRRRRITLENTPGVATNAVAEMTCGLILSALRRIPYLVEQVRGYDWPSSTGSELTGKTLGVYGMGKIGYTVAKRLIGFEPRAIFYADVRASEDAERDFDARRVELTQLFSESDIVSIHAPLTSETKGIVNAGLLRSMRPRAVLVNTARAAIVDPDGLRRALTEGWIACAAFDGYYVEDCAFTNLPRGGDPYGLLSLGDRFFATSHEGFDSYEAISRASRQAAGRITAYFNIAQAA